MGIGDQPDKRNRGAFAYRTYDCVPAAPTHRIEEVDVLVANGLNAQMRAEEIAGVLAYSEDVSAELARIDENAACFWDLSRDEVQTKPPDDASPAWQVWRAWTILMGVEGINIARTHKILHHKRPSVFPLIDNKTIDLLDRGRSAWAAIHDDLTTTPSAWVRLETTVNALLASKGGVPLTRLRMHDILLWTRATQRWDLALQYGGALAPMA